MKGRGRMFNRALWWFTVAVMALAPVWAQSRSHESEAITAEEYEVYAAALHNMVGGPSYVIIDTTTVRDKPENLDSALSLPVNFEKLVTADLVKDFAARSRTRHRIAQRFPKGCRVTLLSEREEDTLFGGSMKDGWNTFYSKYQSSSGITRISRVGFKEVNYTYKLNDALSTLQYPSGNTIDYSYDNAGRVVAVSGFASGIEYWPSGALHTATYGGR